MNENMSVWNDLKLRTSTITLIGLLIILVGSNYVFWGDFRDFAVCIMLIVAGACFGWVLGVFASPYSNTEAARFSSFGKAAGTFVSGYLLAKADGLFTAILSPEFLISFNVGVRLISVLSSMAIFFLFIFIFRNYAPNTRLPNNVTDRGFLHSAHASDQSQTQG